MRGVFEKKGDFFNFAGCISPLSAMFSLLYW